MARRRAEDKSEQVVVVGQVLASEVNIGFEDIVNTAILKVRSNRGSVAETGRRTVQGLRFWSLGP